MVWEMIRPIFLDDDEAQILWTMINPVGQKNIGQSLVDT